MYNKKMNTMFLNSEKKVKHLILKNYCPILEINI